MGGSHWTSQQANQEVVWGATQSLNLLQIRTKMRTKYVHREKEACWLNLRAKFRDNLYFNMVSDFCELLKNEIFLISRYYATAVTVSVVALQV